MASSRTLRRRCFTIEKIVASPIPKIKSGHPARAPIERKRARQITQVIRASSGAPT